VSILKILNLGCGTKISDSPDVTNIDWSLYLRLSRYKAIKPLLPVVLSSDRLKKLEELPTNILVHDLRKGIPYPESSIDVVYHSHVLEHLDRDIGKSFLKEIKRVLKPSGIVRIVVPDLELLCRQYIEHIGQCESSKSEYENHDKYIGDFIEQCVRRQAAGVSSQNVFRKVIEKLIVGDARRRGETHQWMYDKINLQYMLEKIGYVDVEVCRYDISSIPNWNDYGLDVNHDGSQYKHKSLYVEARK